MNFPRKLANNFELMEKLIVKGGIIIPEPENVWISPGVSIGKGTVIYPNTYIISNIHNCYIGENCQIGPNAFLRDWFFIGNNVKIGFGAEVVRSGINDGTKAAHFCHIGDATIGQNCNIAAGVIFCNFDGSNKNKTVVEDDVFIGVNVLLIPSAKRGLRLGTGSYIGAGEIINQDVSPQSVIYTKRSLPIHAERIAVKENGKWRIVSHADFINDKLTPPDGV